MRLVVIVVNLWLLVGCAVNGKKADPLESIRNGHYENAEQIFKANLDSHGKNRLLHHLELGMLKHLQGQYQKSNFHLEKADEISRQLYTISLSEELTELLTGPSYSTYKGSVFEYTFINYYKALNYLKLAEQGNKVDQQQLDSALVEIRKLGNRLSLLTQQTQGYKKNNLNPQEKIASRLLNVFSKTLGQKQHVAQLKYKDDAFAHYLSGILYEMSGEWDSARIEYQKSATAYENGFTAQYKLDDKSINQAWFDVAKIMKKKGGYANQLLHIRQTKLSAKMQKRLDNIQPNQSELLIIQHTGLAPQRRYLNLILTADARTRSLVLSPLVRGNSAERKAQFHWFQMLYADTDIIDIIQNYAAGDLSTVALGYFTKRIPVGKLWRNLVKMGVINAIGGGIRVSVPYYPPIDNQFVKTEFFINGHKQDNLINAHSIARIALQEQLIVANKQIQAALIREIVKAIVAEKTLKELGANHGLLGDIAKIATKTINAVTAAADTRSWLTLPAGVKFSRVPIKKGKSHLTLKTYLQSGQIIEQHHVIEVLDDRPYLWQTRTFSRNTFDVTQKH